MPHLFAVLLLISAVELLLLVLLPWLLAHGTDSLWVGSERLSYLGLSVLSGLLFGTLGGLFAERRDDTPWWALAGQTGVLAAPVFCATGMLESQPLMARLLVAALGTAGAIGAALPARSIVAWTAGTFTRTLARASFMLGNIWLGISLLAALTGAIFWGSWMETWYGHKAAMATIYTSGWIGFLFFAFLFSLVSATLRKFPWRIDQSGWIVVHLALVLLIVGSLMSFWGKREGELMLREGESAAAFQMEDQTRFVLEEARRIEDRTVWRKMDEAICRFDTNPADTQPHETIAMRTGADRNIGIEVSRWFADAERIEEATDTGKEPRLGVRCELGMGRGPKQSLLLAEGEGEAGYPDLLSLSVRRLPEGASAELLRSPAEGQGQLEILNREGAVVHRVSVRAGPHDPASGHSPWAFDEELPGTGVRILGKALFANWQLSNERGARKPIDASPDSPANPALAFSFEGAKGSDPRWAFAWYPGLLAPDPQRNAYSEYSARWQWFPVPKGSLWFVSDGLADSFWVHRSRDGSMKHGPLQPGKPLELGIPLSVTPVKLFTHLEEVSRWELRGFNPQQSVAEVRTGDGADAQTQWLPLGGSISFGQDGETFRLRWVRTQHPLPFQLTLHDFRRDFYPGSAMESTFESYLQLRDHERFKDGADIKIDMNHPLRLAGWRLFQARYSTEGGESTILQVNRDPGLGVIYPACALLTLGMIMVFFQKPFLRALGRRSRAASRFARFGLACAALLLLIMATVPGVIVIVMGHSGLSKGLGAMLVVAGLLVESWLVLSVWTPRLERGAGDAA